MRDDFSAGGSWGSPIWVNTVRQDQEHAMNDTRGFQGKWSRTALIIRNN